MRRRWVVGNALVVGVAGLLWSGPALTKWFTESDLLADPARPVAGPTSSLAVPTGLPTPCAPGALEVTAAAVGASDGRAGLLLNFTTRDAGSCLVHGYPRVVELGPDGAQVGRAVPTPAGPLGGLRPGESVPVVMAKDGDYHSDYASALLESGPAPSAGSSWVTSPVVV